MFSRKRAETRKTGEHETAWVAGGPSLGPGTDRRKTNAAVALWFLGSGPRGAGTPGRKERNVKGGEAGGEEGGCRRFGGVDGEFLNEEHRERFERVIESSEPMRD